MNKKGFTLIELIATIAILAVIALISFVSITKVLEKSRIDNCNILVENIKTSAEEYVSDNRYDSAFVSNVKVDNDGKNIVIITAADLNLKGDIINPISNETITKSTVKIEITLNKDYTAKSVSVSGISCDVK